MRERRPEYVWFPPQSIKAKYIGRGATGVSATYPSHVCIPNEAVHWAGAALRGGTTVNCASEQTLPFASHSTPIKASPPDSTVTGRTEGKSRPSGLTISLPNIGTCTARKLGSLATQDSWPRTSRLYI